MSWTSQSGSKNQQILLSKCFTTVNPCLRVITSRKEDNSYSSLFNYFEWFSVLCSQLSLELFWVEEFKCQQSSNFEITAAAYCLPEISPHEHYRLCFLPIPVPSLVFSNQMKAWKRLCWPPIPASLHDQRSHEGGWSIRLGAVSEAVSWGIHKDLMPCFPLISFASLGRPSWCPCWAKWPCSTLQSSPLAKHSLSTYKNLPHLL